MIVDLFECPYLQFSFSFRYVKYIFNDPLKSPVPTMVTCHPSWKSRRTSSINQEAIQSRITCMWYVYLIMEDSDRVLNR